MSKHPGRDLGGSRYDPSRAQQTHTAATGDRKGSPRIEGLIRAIKDLDKEIRSLEYSKILREDLLGAPSVSHVDGEVTDLKKVRASKINELEGELSISKTIRELRDEAKEIQKTRSRQAHLDWAERFCDHIEDYMLVQRLEHFKSGAYETQIQKLSSLFRKIVILYSNERGSPRAAELEGRYGKLKSQAMDAGEDPRDTEEPDNRNSWKPNELRTGRVDKTTSLVRKNSIKSNRASLYLGQSVEDHLLRIHLGKAVEKCSEYVESLVNQKTHYEEMKSRRTDEQQMWAEQLEEVRESAEAQGIIFNTRFEGVQEAIGNIGPPLDASHIPAPQESIFQNLRDRRIQHQQEVRRLKSNLDSIINDLMRSSIDALRLITEQLDYECQMQRAVLNIFEHISDSLEIFGQSQESKMRQNLIGELIGANDRRLRAGGELIGIFSKPWFENNLLVQTLHGGYSRFKHINAWEKFWYPAYHDQGEIKDYEFLKRLLAIIRNESRSFADVRYRLLNLEHVSESPKDLGLVYSRKIGDIARGDPEYMEALDRATRAHQKWASKHPDPADYSVPPCTTDRRGYRGLTVLPHKHNELVAFFTSPDIARAFHTKKWYAPNGGHMTTDQFIKKVNGLVEQPYPRGKLEEFLRWCDIYQFLFEKQGSLWSRAEAGWETVEENLISGHERAQKLKHSRQFLDWKAWIIEASGNLIQSPARNYLEDDLLEKIVFINPAFPKTARFLREMLDHCDSTCELFMWADRPNGLLRRIDNGWPKMDIIQPLSVEPVGYDNFKQNMVEKYPRNRQEISEDDMLNWYNEKFPCQPIPPQQLRIFLRRLHDRCELFAFKDARFEANMTLKVLSKGWVLSDLVRRKGKNNCWRWYKE